MALQVEVRDAVHAATAALWAGPAAPEADVDTLDVVEPGAQRLANSDPVLSLDRIGSVLAAAPAGSECWPPTWADAARTRFSESRSVTPPMLVMDTDAGGTWDAPRQGVFDDREPRSQA